MTTAAVHTIVLAGGGTGGHVTPALALADAFVGAGLQVLFIGTPQGLEATLVPKRGYAIELVSGSRLVGGGIGAKVRGLRDLARGILAARAILSRIKPSLVLGVGGYASGAALLAARTLGIPTAIHESNAVPGLTNRVLGQLVDRVYLGFGAATDAFDRERTLVSGNPVRSEIAAVAQARAPRGQRPAHVLVVGGSQGSEFLNERIPGLLSRIAEAGIALEVRHQVGKLGGDPVRARYAALGMDARIDTFIDDMAGAYAWADFAITRSGSGTVAELAAAALPALLVPFPHAAGDHQAANAQAFADAGAGWWQRQESWDESAMAARIGGLLGDDAIWSQTCEAARRLGATDAGQTIVEDCAIWMEGRW